MSADWENAAPAVVVRNGEGPADYRDARRRKATLADPTKVDRLPPHSTEAEQGVLGCILCDSITAMNCIAKARKRLRDLEGEEFYDLRHRDIWLTLCRMYDDRVAGLPLSSTATASDGIDLITVQQRMKDVQKLDMVGGLAYLVSLPDAVPSAANIDYYLEIVREKYALRMSITFSVEFVSRAYEWQGQVDHLIDAFQIDVAKLSRLCDPPEGAAKMYLKPVDMGDEFWQRWFGKRKGVHGLALPDLAFGNFPFLVRKRELTLLEAETKMGKSTLASYVIVHLLQQGMRAVIDSREVHYADSMKKLFMQLTGVTEGALCIVGEKEVKELGYFKCQCDVCKVSSALFQKAVAWLNGRVIINRTTGIKHWRDLLDAFHELAKEGYDFFLLDSLMRIGIADDDFTQQAACVSSFAQFAIETDSAMWLINHRNKGDGDYRRKSGGSYKVAANASNICSVEKNEKKFEALAGDFDCLRSKAITWDDFKQLDTVKKWLHKHDAKFYIHDQRLDGTRSNAARELWFLKRSGQYFDHRHPRPDRAVNWLEEWTAKEAKEKRKMEAEEAAAAAAAIAGNGDGETIDVEL